MVSTHKFFKIVFQVTTVLISLLVISCSSSDSDSSDTTSTFNVSGQISGLQGSITLLNNGSESLTINSSGDFSFSTQLEVGASYDVTIQAQPDNQNCSVSNGSGSVTTSGVNTITVSCITNTYSIGGTLHDLQGSINLSNNGTETLSLNNSGAFNFSVLLIEGESYNVTVQTQPSGQTCTVINGSGSVNTSDVNDITVNCVTDTFKIGGELNGLLGSIVLQNNATDNLTVNSSGSFIFTTLLEGGSSYDVSVLTQPNGQNCIVTNGIGTVTTSDINNITVSCSNATFSIGGTIVDLQGSITLNNNGNESLILSNSGVFSFNSLLSDGDSYDVTIQTQPINQICSISNASGTVSGASISNISVNCVTPQYSVGGAVSGLTGTLVIQNNSGELLSVGGNGVYAFVEKLTNSEIYNVDILQNPVAQICAASNASGQINNADVNNVDITCTSSTITVSLSGSYQAAPLIQVDSDINDPSAIANVDNNTFTSAQAISNFSKVQGFATASGTGRTLEGDRFATTADDFDVYRVGLQKNQTLRLQVVDFVLTDVFQGDLDLILFDSANLEIARSDSVTEFENIIVPADGEYFIAVNAYSGTSKYTLSLDGVSVLTAPSSYSADFKIGEAIIQFKANSSINDFKASNQLMTISNHDASRVALSRFEVSGNNLSITNVVKQSGFELELARVNPESYRKYKTLKQIKAMNQLTNVEYAEPNYIYHPQLVPNDEFYNLQWHYPAINLPQAWDITTGSRTGSDVIVAVVDTGVFLAHPEFSGQLVSGYDFISDIQMAADGDGIDANPDDPGDGSQFNSSWHGTHVSGTVAALSDNNSSITGVAWEAKIMPVRALGVGGGTGYDIIQSIRYAAGLSNDSNTVPAQKADIINLSLGGSGYSQAAQDAYNAIRAEGVIVVAAAGNENTSQFSYPASYDGVVSVSATDFANLRAPYSNFGTRIDVAAPGGNQGADLNNDGYGDGVLSTLVDDSTGTRTATLSFYQGTSMAAPHVAGVFALMRAVYPTLSPDEVDDLLTSGSLTNDIGTAGRDDLYGYGLIDALKAVQAAQQLANGGTAPPQPALIVASPGQLTMGLNSSSQLTLSNLGDLQTNVTSISSDSSWLTISASNVDANGLGDYQVLIDRSGLSNSSYMGELTFNLGTGNSVTVQVSILVGLVDTTGNIGTIYMLLLDSNNSVIDQVLAVDQGNGVFDYNFTNVSAGAYRIIAGSDIDNDLFICQLAEACGGYPTIDSLSNIEAVNSDITELDFIIDILANFGTNSLSMDVVNSSTGFQRKSITNKQLSPRIQ